VRGGYSTTDWNTPILLLTTLLDAQSGGRVAYVTGGSSVTVTLEKYASRCSMLASNGGGIYG